MKEWNLVSSIEKPGTEPGRGLIFSSARSPILKLAANVDQSRTDEYLSHSCFRLVMSGPEQARLDLFDKFERDGTCRRLLGSRLLEHLNQGNETR